MWLKSRKDFGNKIESILDRRGVADVGKTTGGSPWDEPLPEQKDTKKPVPTIVGDLDVAKTQQAASPVAQQKPVELKLPTNTDEKVGAKINPVPEETMPTATVAPVITPVAKVPDSNQAAQPSVSPPTDSNFWQSVYGQAGNPDGSIPTANPVATSTPVVASMKPVSDIKPVPAPSVTSTPPQPVADTSHLYQPAPIPATPAIQSPVGLAQPQQVPQPAAQSKASTQQSLKTFMSRKTTYIIAGVLGLMILFAGGIMLTEKGLISIGLEKVYGAVRLEALWGGLPSNAENAFAMSAIKMKSEKSFKISSSATVTVNKGIKSNLISPIVSAAALPVLALKDEQVGSKMKAILTAVSNEISTDTSNDLFQDDSSTSTDQSVNTDTTTNTADEPTINSSGSFSSGSNISTVEELTTSLSAQITENVSGVNIGIKSSKSSNSNVGLVYSKNKMYLKTSSDIIYDSKSKGGWTSFDMNKFDSSGPGPEFWGSNFVGSGFSIVGSRGNSEIINGVRCFHYNGKATIGDALKSFDLTNSSVSSLDLDYWLGVNDHLPRRITMKIIPGSQAAISRIDMTLDLSDFGSDSSDFIVPATSLPYTGLITAAQADLATATGRDAQRKTDLASIAKALESYHSAKGNYPSVTVAEKISSSSVGTLGTALVPNYLTALPLDPGDPTNYYGYESGGTTYKLSCVLEDKTDASGKNVGSVYLYFLSSL